MKVIFKGAMPNMFNFLSTLWESKGATNGTLVGGLVASTIAKDFANNLTVFLVWLTTSQGRLSQMPEEAALAYAGWVGLLIQGLTFVAIMAGGTVLGGLVGAGATKVQERVSEKVVEKATEKAIEQAKEQAVEKVAEHVAEAPKK